MYRRYLIASALTLSNSRGHTGLRRPTRRGQRPPQRAPGLGRGEHYSTLVYANDSDTIAAAQQMQKAIDAFLAKRSLATQNAARKAWLAALRVLRPDRGLPLHDGPIDNADGPEGQINAWPMDESYVDYVVGDDNAGLINNRKLPITKVTPGRAERARRRGEHFHRLACHRASCCGARTWTTTGPARAAFDDFVDGKNPNAVAAPVPEVVTELPLDDLNHVVRPVAARCERQLPRPAFDQGQRRIPAQEFLLA